MALVGRQKRNRKGTPRGSNSQQPPCALIGNQGGGSWRLLGARIVSKTHLLEHRFPPSPGASIGRRGGSNWHPSSAKVSAAKPPSVLHARSIPLHARSVLGLQPTTFTAPYFLSILLPVLLAVLWPFYRPFLAGTKGPAQEREQIFVCSRSRSKSVPNLFPF